MRVPDLILCLVLVPIGTAALVMVCMLVFFKKKVDYVWKIPFKDIELALPNESLGTGTFGKVRAFAVVSLIFP